MKTKNKKKSILNYKLQSLPEKGCFNCKNCEIDEQDSSIVYPTGYNYNCKFKLPKYGYSGNVDEYGICDNWKEK